MNKWLLLMCVLALPFPALAAEWQGKAVLEGRYFPESGLNRSQGHEVISLALQPEFYHDWTAGPSFTFVPFARLDSEDEERSHWDVREMNLLWYGNNWQLRAGMAKVFWGVTEFVHLVDIINQTDLVEGPDGEEKLGQAMLHLSLEQQWGVLDFFVLPWFRERTYPGRRGRLRSVVPVDMDQATYESGAEEFHPDFALRYSHTLGDVDLGVAHFQGTGREPALRPEINSRGEMVLAPWYHQIEQTSVDLQWVAGQCLWKLESLYRSGTDEDFAAWVAGFEYTLVGLGGSAMDLGLIGEMAYDGRSSEAATAFENDLMAGLRLTVNDVEGSELLAGLIQDLGSPSRLLTLEASRRLSDSLKFSLEAGLFLNAPADDPLYQLRNDDYLQLELAYYF